MGNRIRRGQFLKVQIATRVDPVIFKAFKIALSAEGRAIAAEVQRGMVSYLLTGAGQTGKKRYDMKRILGICLYCLDQAVPGFSICKMHREKHNAAKRKSRENP